MLAHLFDHDNIYINKLEAITDRFLEIIGIEESKYQLVRDKLINYVSLNMLARLVLKLPKEQQSVFKTLSETQDIAEIEKLKAKFKPEDIIEEFHLSAKEILNEKYNQIKSKLTSENQQLVEELFGMIGRY